MDKWGVEKEEPAMMHRVRARRGLQIAFQNWASPESRGATRRFSAHTRFGKLDLLVLWEGGGRQEEQEARGLLHGAEMKAVLRDGADRCGQMNPTGRASGQW